jgi:hypothetical protein
LEEVQKDFSGATRGWHMEKVVPADAKMVDQAASAATNPLTPDCNPALFLPPQDGLRKRGNGKVTDYEGLIQDEPRAAREFKVRKSVTQIKGSTFDFEPIESMNKARMEYIEVAKTRHPTPKDLFAWHGTITKAVFCNSYLFWLANALYVAVVVHNFCSSSDDGCHMPIPEKNYLGETNGFLAFFVIFYLGQCFSRWQDTFSSSMGVLAEVNNCALHFSASCAGENIDYARQMVRYLNAAMVLGFVGLSLEFDNQFFDAYAKHHGLVTDEEAAMLVRTNPEESGEGYRLCIKWALQIADSVQSKHKVWTPPEHSAVKGRMLNLRSKIVSLGDNDLEPIPFAYFNMLSTLLHVYLPVHAIYIGLAHHSEWYYSWWQVVLVNYAFIGMSELALYLVRPYGHRRNHFALYDWMSTSIQNTRKMLSDSGAWHYTPELNAHTFVDGRHHHYSTELNPSNFVDRCIGKVGTAAVSSTRAAANGTKGLLSAKKWKSVQ